MPSAPTTDYFGLRTRLPLPPGTLMGVAVALLSVAASAYFIHQSLETRRVAADRVSHTLEVMQEVEGVLSTLKDAETGQRGFLLTGEERYLEPYVTARAALPGEIRSLRTLVSDNPQQLQRIETLEQLERDILEELELIIGTRRSGDGTAAVARLRTDRGRAAMDRARAVVGEIENEEQALLATRQAAWQDAQSFTTRVTWGSSILLILLISGGAAAMSRDFKIRETETWLRSGQAGLSTEMQGEQRLEVLGGRVLTSLAGFLEAQVGAIYISDGAGRFRRFAAYALPADAEGDTIRPGDGLAGQAARENRVLHVTEVPDGYLAVASGLGRGMPAELIIAPATVDRVVQAVVELGFFRRVDADEVEFLRRIAEPLGVAVRASKDRSRLEELLEEVQRQAEELQTQQEELRVSNEELEEQSRVLKESHARLETQQAELEQINSQLEEQTEILASQKDILSRAQIDLTAKASELERANQYKSEFLANMSHELRTPLNSSLILAKLLADNKTGNLTGEQVKFAQTIFAAGNDLLALINDILDLSKVESGKVELSPEQVPVALTIETLVRTLRPLAEQKGLRLVTAVDADVPAQMETDAQRLGQILKNLLSNAIKFTERGEVSLHVSKAANGGVVFAVRDTGVGIAAHQQDIIFEAFRQADGSTHRKYGGTGLGLSISRDLARLLGGDITVVSSPGEGSTFTLALPLVYQPAAPSAISGQPVAAPMPQPAPRSGRPPAPAPPLLAPPGPIAPVAPASSRTTAIASTPGARCILVIEDDARFADDPARSRARAGLPVRGDAHRARRAGGCDTIPAQRHPARHEPARSLGPRRPRSAEAQSRDPSHAGARHLGGGLLAARRSSSGAVGYALKPVKREELVEAFQRLEAKFTQGLRRVLVVEDDERQRESIRVLLKSGDVQIVGVETAAEALNAAEVDDVRLHGHGSVAAGSERLRAARTHGRDKTTCRSRRSSSTPADR